MFDEGAFANIPDSKLTIMLEEEYEMSLHPDWSPDRKDAILDEIDRRIMSQEQLKLRIEDLEEELKELKEQREFDKKNLTNYYCQREVKDAQMDGLKYGIEIAERILRAANGVCHGGSGRE